MTSCILPRPTFRDRSHLLWEVITFPPQLLPSLPISFQPQEMHFSFNPGESLELVLPGEAQDLLYLTADRASLHPSAFLPPGWSPGLTFLPSCLSIIPWLGWLRCSCCNFSEQLRDWKGSKFLHRFFTTKIKIFMCMIDVGRYRTRTFSKAMKHTNVC